MGGIQMTRFGNVTFDYDSYEQDKQLDTLYFEFDDEALTRHCHTIMGAACASQGTVYGQDALFALNLDVQQKNATIDCFAIGKAQEDDVKERQVFLQLHVKSSADEVEQLVTYALAEIREMMIKDWNGEA